MKYYAVTFPNHTTLVVKCEKSIASVLGALCHNAGLQGPSGAIYNPKTFLTLTEISTPDKRQQLVAQELSKVLIG